jgi:predicted Rossmann-fold nucleotide-binding protein
VGISPAHSLEEHQERYGLPRQGSDVVIYTGFGYKGRNVVNIRSSDIVVILRGSIGTLNEFTIAYDEGKSSVSWRAQAVWPTKCAR